MKARNTFKALVIILYLFSFANVVADELKEGAWQGVFINHKSQRYDIKYNVSYVNVDEEGKGGNKEKTKEKDKEKNNDKDKDKDKNKGVLQIEMINLDLEPMPEYTYQLIDIKVTEKKLSFKIPREHDTKHCILTKQDESQYEGECQSDKAEAGVTSQLTMAIPSD